MEKVLPLKNIEAICSNKQNAELYVILLMKLLRPHLYQIKKDLNRIECYTTACIYRVGMLSYPHRSTLRGRK